MRTSIRRRRRVTSRRRNYPLPFMNPPRRKARRARRGAVSRSRHHSPAMRAKISRAVKAAMRRRSSGGMVHRRRSVRRHSFAMAPRRRRSYAVARRSNRIVMGRLLNPRGGRRRSFRRRSFRRRNPGGILGSISGMLSKETLMLAGGAIVASIGTGYVLNKFGANLPLYATAYGPALYQLAIPLAGAYLLRNRNRALAQGLVVGGVVMAITTVMKSGMLGGTASATIAQGPLGNFYRVQPMGLAGELGRPARGMRPVGTYIGAKTYNTIPNAVNRPVFAQGAWGQQ